MESEARRRSGASRRRLRDFLAEPYHYLALPLLAYLAWFPSAAVQLGRNLVWASPFDSTSAVFPVTYAAAALTLAAAIWFGSKRLGMVRAVYYGVGLAFGAVGLYELVFDEFFPNTLYVFKLGMLCFVVLGLVSLRVWRLSAGELFAFVGWVLLFFAWVFVDPTIPVSRADLVPLAFNAVTKVGAFGVFSLPFFVGLSPSLARRLRLRPSSPS